MRRLEFFARLVHRHQFIQKILSRRLANDVEEYRSKQLIALLDDVVRVEILRLPRAAQVTRRPGELVQLGPFLAREQASRALVRRSLTAHGVEHSIHHRRRVVDAFARLATRRRVARGRARRPSSARKATERREREKRTPRVETRERETFERERARVSEAPARWLDARATR